MSYTFRYVVAALLAATPSLLAAQQTPASGPPPSAAELTVLVDSVVTAGLLTQGVPGVSVAVMRGDEMLVDRTWGRADVASGRAAEPSTPYALGSNTKQFTAALVLRLVDRGRLALGDTLGRHLTGVRPEWGAITIEQLLNHTSGLQRSGTVDRSRMEADVPGDSLLARASRDTMAAQPGTRFIYSNVGYAILGVLVQELYGKSYADALRDEIARPLGLTGLRYCGDVEAGSGAPGYRLSYFDGTLSPAPDLHPSQQLGAGGICATAADFARWNRALHGGRVLSETSYRAMTTPRGAAIPVGYGFGLSVRPAPWGGPAITHAGHDVAGFTSDNGWYPADSLSVTVLYNTHPHVTTEGTHVVAALALGHTPPATRTSLPVTGPTTPASGIVGEGALRQFVGEYEIGPGAVFSVEQEEGTFFVRPPGGERNPLVHRSGATYAVGSADAETTVTFLADAEGQVVGFMARDEGSPNRRLRKIR